VCATINGGVCKPAGSTCGADSECCSSGCIAGVCSLATSFCKQNNESCRADAECCGGECNIAAGQTVGTCGDLSISGIGSCVVAGTVVSCPTVAVGQYACNTSCCSKSCGTNDSAPGYAICQAPSGCGPLGERCKADKDCCGGLIAAGLRCTREVSTDPFGRCASENSCSKPGQVCKTASSTTACSVANNCCEPADIPSGNCNSNPDACCRQDNLGIPRCVGFAICRAPGETCTGTQDCCNALPCVDDGTGTGVKKCNATACVVDLGFCTVDKDCCGGNCYKQNAGDITGQCKVPTCTKKTCADYPGKNCGQLSDGCGGLTPDCGTCTYPQTCGGAGTPNVCGGTICSANTCAGLGADCGTVPDGCGNTLTCPDCPAGTTCGGGGVANKCGAPMCTALTCGGQNIQCGQTGDGCGNVLTCANCPVGQTCGGGGIANQCGAPACNPIAVCPAGKNCGDIPNGCGGTVHCGDCPVGETCGGGGSANVCGKATCMPKTCVQLGAQCGGISDGCGGVLACGPCGANEFCNGQNLCVGVAFTPKTCVQLGVQCGPTANNCGGLVDCGGCPVGQGCGAGGVPGKCGSQPCAPKTCAELGAVCGQVANGCGGLTPDCGTCAGALSCKNGACVSACTPITCASVGANCGPIADGCGGSVDCGLCPAGQTCGFNGQSNKCGQDVPK